MSREREHEILANSMEAVVENLDVLVQDAVKNEDDVDQLLTRVKDYTNSLRRVTSLIKR